MAQFTKNDLVDKLQWGPFPDLSHKSEIKISFAWSEDCCKNSISCQERIQDFPKGCANSRGSQLITVRKRSCGKVMFLHLSVSHSIHGRGGGVCLSARWDTHLLPSARWDRHGYCCRWHASYWNTFLLNPCFGFDTVK